ncbi:hypothetical protein ACWEFJ_37645 [Actinosynnema sp. NPDC004786]
MVETVVWVVAPQVLALLGVAARLWWRAVRERRRQETLRELAGSLTGGTGGAVEFDDVRGDGSRLRVRLVVTGTPQEPGREVR